jgi:hypothetical protein
MRTLRKADIESMERELQVLKNPEKFLGGTKGDWDDPYSKEEYESMLESGTWNDGGYVSGMGYVLGEVVVTGSASGSSGSSDYYYPQGGGFMSDTSSTYEDDNDTNGSSETSESHGNGLSWMGEGIGINASCFINATVTHWGSQILISANLTGAMLSQAEYIGGIVEILLDGNRQGTLPLQYSTSGYITSSGTYPLGEATLDLSAFSSISTGSIEIRVTGGYRTQTPAGPVYGTASCVIYRLNK